MYELEFVHEIEKTETRMVSKQPYQIIAALNRKERHVFNVQKNLSIKFFDPRHKSMLVLGSPEMRKEESMVDVVDTVASF